MSVDDLLKKDRLAIQKSLDTRFFVSGPLNFLNVLYVRGFNARRLMGTMLCVTRFSESLV